MGKTETSYPKILTGAYAYLQNGSTTAWAEGNNELYAARNGESFYFSKMTFSTEGLKVKGPVAIFFEITASQKSNPYGTTLILTTSELTPYQVYQLKNEDAVKAVSGYVAHVNCTSHTVSGDISKGGKASYSLTADMEKDTVYYIYIKRQVGWENNDSGLNGWTGFYNPAYSAEFAEYTTLSLTYDAGPEGCVVDGGEFQAGTMYTYHNGAWHEATGTVAPFET